MANRRYIDFPIASTSGDTDIILIWQGGANKQTTKATFLSGLPENLDELNDVAISGLTNGQILRYDSVTGKWENTDQGNLDLNDLNDVQIVSPSNGQVLVYNSSTSKWENSSAGFVPYTGAVTTVNLGAQTIQAGSFVKAGGTAAQFLKADGSLDSNVYGTGTVTSVALTMPSAFSVANSPITTAGTLAVTGAGTVGQYIRGDGSLADFPESSGGGSSVSYYLNGSVAQGTIGGVAYKELNKVPILGAGTDFTINANGYIASFITDAGDPNLLEIPAGNWTFETYFSASSGGGSPTFYVELYKVNSGGTATLIASNSTFPELIAFGTNVIPYFSTLAVPTTALALTDRLAIRYYVNHSGRTITLHTEDNHLCQIITTFTTGITALNGLTAQVQNFAVGTSGTDFAISSATATHTFNLPTASATNRGALSSADWSMFNSKQNALTNPVTGTGTTNYLPKFTGSTTIGNSQVFDNGTVVGIATTSLVADALLPIQINAGASGQAYFASNNNGNYGLLMGYDNFNGYARIRNVSNTALTFETNNTQKMRLDKDGNLGLGVNSSAWSQFKSLEIGTIGNGISGFIGASSTVMHTNAYWNGTNWIYANTANSAQIEIQGGNIIAFKQATSGTAGNVITYTQPITLFSGGNLLLSNGAISDNGSKLQVVGSATFSGSTAINLTGNGGFFNAANKFGLDHFSGASRFYSNGANISTKGAFEFHINNSTGSLDDIALGISNTGAATFSSNQNATSTYTIQNTDTTNTSSRLRLDLISGNSALSIVSIHNDHNYIASVSGKDLYFQQTFGGATNMVIKSNGNVGIGTTTDTGGVRLQVAPSASTWISGTFAGTGGTDKVVIGNYENVAAIGAHSGALNAWANLAINFGGGNVLIGTTTSGASKLRIVGLPTSAVGLSSGDVYNLSGVLMIA